MLVRKNVSWVVVGCLLVGAGAAAAAAQIVTRPAGVRHFNCGVFPVLGGERAFLYLSLDDAAKQPAARARLQFIDVDGTEIASDDVTLAAGQSASLQIAGPVLVRAPAEVFESTTTLTSRRTAVGSVHVVDDLATEKPRPVCNADASGLGGGRQ